MEKLAGSTAIAALIHQTKAALRSKQDALQIDAAPTAGSLNIVTSGGVKAALDELKRQIPSYADGDEVSY